MTTTTTTDFAQELKNQTSGCRLNTYSLSTRRVMNKSQVDQVAETFNADADYVSGSRKIIDRKHELVKPIFSVLSQAKMLVKANTLDYPEKGLRLVRLSKIEWLTEKIAELRADLEQHLLALDNGWESIKQEAKQRLVDLYSESDYAVKPSDCFAIEISFPSIEPDSRLMHLHPELYAREQERIRNRFEEAVAAAEAAAAEQLNKLLSHFVTSLTEVTPDGKRKTFKNSTIENIRVFANAFKESSIGSNEQLDALVAQIGELADGVDIVAVRKSSAEERQAVAERFAEMLAKVDELAIDRPVRELELD